MTVIVEVNSPEHVAPAIPKMEESLGDCIAIPLVEICQLEKIMTDDLTRAANENTLEIPPPEVG
jgi:hypothetical protein